MRFKLHRSKSKSDWGNVPPRKRNICQRWAAKTRGIVTPGNILTLVGFVILIAGLYQIVAGHYIWGVAGIIVGRAFDILDGWAADATGTKSLLGEAVDAVADKFGTLFTLIAFLVADLAPWWILLALLLPHLIITITVFVAQQKKRKIHPSRLGKYSMAGMWIGLSGLVFVEIVDVSWPNILSVASYVVIVSSVLLGGVAAYSYARAKN